MTKIVDYHDDDHIKLLITDKAYRLGSLRASGALPNRKELAFKPKWELKDLEKMHKFSIGKWEPRKRG